jgi:hypothetical protein
MLLIPDIRVLEKRSLVCPFGVRFWDSVTRTSIGDGLRVTARPALGGSGTLDREAILTRSDVFAFHNLPGLRREENGQGDSTYWDEIESHPMRRKSFVVKVNDRFGRFLPFTFTAEMPHRGLFQFDPIFSPLSPLAPPQSGALGLPLFSAPARPIPGGMAVVRAQITTFPGNDPASFALVEIQAKSVSGPMVSVHGVADLQGGVAVIFPYPELPPPASFGSPSAGEGQALSSREWTVDVRVFWGPVPSDGGLPDLADVLFNQPERVVLSGTSPVQLLAPQSLRFGRDLILRSGQGASLSFLSINSAASPP